MRHGFTIIVVRLQEFLMGSRRRSRWGAESRQAPQPGQRNPDNPDHILESAEKIANCIPEKETFKNSTAFHAFMYKSPGAAPIHGWLALVKKDGSLSPRFPLVEHRYVFGRYAPACSMLLGMDASGHARICAVVIV